MTTHTQPLHNSWFVRPTLAPEAPTNLIPFVLINYSLGVVNIPRSYPHEPTDRVRARADRLASHWNTTNFHPPECIMDGTAVIGDDLP